MRELLYEDPTARDLALSHGLHLGRYKISANCDCAGVRVTVVGDDSVWLILGVPRWLEG